MSYTINKSDGTLLVSIPDETVDTASTSLTLIGRHYAGFGEFEVENIVHLLENFSHTVSPAHPLKGQFWYDSASSEMKVWNGTAWLRVMVGTDDANIIPGLTIGGGLTVSAGTLSANVQTVAGRTGAVVLGVADVSGAAPLASPALSGTPTSPTAVPGTNTTQIATTAFVHAQIAASVNDYGAGLGLSVSGGNLNILGTSNRISVSGLGVDIAATYAGQTSISTLGNVTSGQWSASPVALVYGGTGATTAANARTNLDALQHSALAHSLRNVSTSGLIINNGGSAIVRNIVSGTPTTLEVSNGDGLAGDITISLLGDGNTVLGIDGGGTGQTTQTAAFNALSPSTSTGDLIYFDTSAHVRLAGKTDADDWYLMSGLGNARPRWTNDVDAGRLNNQNGAYYLNRANHTGTNDASLLNGQNAAYYLNYANFTGQVPSNIVFSAATDASALANNGSGYYRFNNGITIQWGKKSGYYGAETAYPMTFPLAFTKIFNVTATVISDTPSKFIDWFSLVTAITPTGFSFYNSKSSSDAIAHNGWYWHAIGYIA